LAQHPELALSTHEGVHVQYGTATTPMQSVETLVFTNKTILYVDAYLTDEEKAQILDSGRQRGVSLDMRDRKYADDKAAARRRDAFISFDWRNRTNIARPLAIAL